MSKKSKLMKAAFDDREWHAATLGHFLGLLVDSGDEAVLWRVVEDRDEDGQGRFKRVFEIVALPQGQVLDAILEKAPIGVHSVLKALIDGGVVR